MYYEKRLNLFVLTLNNRGLGTGAFTLQFVKKNPVSKYVKS